MSRYVCACVCLCVFMLQVCANVSLIKRLPTICCVQSTGFGGEGLSLPSRSSQSSWGSTVCAKVCVVCGYLGTSLCPRTYSCTGEPALWVLPPFVGMGLCAGLKLC